MRALRLALGLGLGVGLGLALFGGKAFASPAAKVTLLEGTAVVSAEGRTEAALKLGRDLQVGDHIKTGPKSRLELSLPDGSALRLGAGTELALDTARFEGRRREAVGVTVTLGRVWAKAAKAVGASFEVRTKNAVSGVRGTSFTVVAQADSSAIVRVYAGTVGVRKKGGPTGAPRVQVPGPKAITKGQWEEIIASAMKQVKVSALGDLSPAESFEDEGDELEWAQWNQGRDGAH
jgi:ferric-dicitrate binding protein FerR (iron transport regulator)